MKILIVGLGSMGKRRARLTKGIDSNIRIAPTYPTLPELRLACELLCVAVRLASVEKLLGA